MTTPLARRAPLAGRIAAGEPAVLIEGLAKQVRHPLTRRSRWILDGIDLRLERGEIFGLLGPNGAGKTTTLHCLVGISRPTRGRVRLCGADPAAARERGRLGFLPERPRFYDSLTPREFLDLCGRLHGLDGGARRRRRDELLARLGLDRQARSPIRKLSKGELQRLGIAQAVLHEPELLILDEPMSGLDPLGRRDLRDLVEDHRRRGGTVLFSSHVVPDVEALCDRIGVLHRGRLIRCGRIDEITAVRLRDVDIVVRGVAGELLAQLVGPMDEIQPLGGDFRVRIQGPERVDRLLVRVLQAGGRILTLERRRERLEDYLIRTTALEEGEA